MVWQKRNETDFLLTMNYILFTNQGYLLQNSPLGQLHNDGGVVSIVGSNAGFTKFRGSVKITGYPIHLPVSPTLPHP